MHRMATTGDTFWDQWRRLVDFRDEFEMNSVELFVKELRIRSECSANRGDIFSRECESCRRTDPTKRSVAIKCGHVACHKCAKKSKKCLICKKRSKFRRLCEDRIDRECQYCFRIPQLRAFYDPCGHIVCAMQLCALAVRHDSPLRCPLCHSETTMRLLREETIERVIYRRDTIAKLDEIVKKDKEMTEEVERIVKQLEAISKNRVALQAEGTADRLLKDLSEQLERLKVKMDNMSKELHLFAASRQ